MAGRLRERDITFARQWPVECRVEPDVFHDADDGSQHGAIPTEPNSPAYRILMSEVAIGQGLINDDNGRRVWAVLIGKEASAEHLQTECRKISRSCRGDRGFRHVSRLGGRLAFEEHFRGVISVAEGNIFARTRGGNLRQILNAFKQTIVEAGYQLRVAVPG